MNVSAHIYTSLASDGEAKQPQSGSRGVAAFIVVALVLLAAFVFILPYAPTAVKGGFFSHLTSLTSGGGTNSTTTTSSLNYNLYNPLIQGGSANISYPSNYTALANYALGQINQDRATFSLSPVNLSTSASGQQHADSMLRYGYFSHYDTQGFKPYMRYTLLGGRGAAEENVAYIYNCDGFGVLSHQCAKLHFTTSSSVEAAIAALEHSMMYNDSACCNNGHRDNILTGLHNRVSIGVAYNGTNAYFVEDFENYYINLDFSVSSSYTVTMTGTPFKAGIMSNSIFISYDSTPSTETASQLNSGPREYGPGLIIGGVLPSCSVLNCPAFQQGITVYADTWKFDSTQVDIAFSLHDFIQHYGAGVYNVYLITGNDTSSAVTSTSVFVASP